MTSEADPLVHRAGSWQESGQAFDLPTSLGGFTLTHTSGRGTFTFTFTFTSLAQPTHSAVQHPRKPEGLTLARKLHQRPNAGPQTPRDCPVTTLCPPLPLRSCGSATSWTVRRRSATAETSGQVRYRWRFKLVARHLACIESQGRGGVQWKAPGNLDGAEAQCNR